MANTFFIVLIGLIGGAAVGLQSPLAGAISQRLGGTAGSFFVHLSGTIFSAALLLLRGGENLRDWRTLPWYLFMVGLFGLILYQTIAVTLPRLGSMTMITLIIIGQLLVGMLIDHFGWLGVTVHPISLSRVLGVLVLMLGGYLIAR